MIVVRANLTWGKMAMCKSEYVSRLEKGKWKYKSGKYEFSRPDGTSEIFYLTREQARFMCKIYERIGFKEVYILEEIHNTDLPKWERI